MVAQWAVQISVLSGPPLWCREDGRGWTYDDTESQSLLPAWMWTFCLLLHAKEECLNQFFSEEKSQYYHNAAAKSLQ